MVISTKAIVISAIKYGDNNLIVKCYTEKEGVKSYLLRGILSSKKGKIRKAHFQPLTQLRIIANHNKKGNLNSIKDVEVIYHYTSIFTNVFKQTIVLFLSEILSYSLQEEEENPDLYKYIETSLLWLDTHNKTANFHLLFLLNLTKYLGFYPDVNNSGFNYFNMDEGSFVKESTLISNIITGVDLINFKKLLGTNFDDLDKMENNAQSRQQILQILIRYFELHLSGFRTPKSLEVLKTVFS